MIADPFQSIEDMAILLRRREISSVELTQTCLDRIDRLNAGLHAFSEIDADYALTQARKADAMRASGTADSALLGMPLALSLIHI